MSVQQTSLEAYHSIRDSLGHKQLEVLKVFRASPHMWFTDKELSRILGWAINTVTPRRLELEQGKYITRFEDGVEKKVPVVYETIVRNVMAWKLVEI